MASGAKPAGRFEALAKHLRILGSNTRLEILHALRTRKALHEIQVTPSLSREDEDPGRPLTRQAVTHHIEQLQGEGLVYRLPGEGARGDLLMLNHERLFAIVDEIRNLSKLSPIAQERDVIGSTVDRHEGTRPRLPAPPRLLVAYGRDDGVAFSLDARSGKAWTIGRAPGCEVRLDYDPFLSARNTTVHRTDEGFVVEDLGGRNGTMVNWLPVAKNGRQKLVAGDIITTGRSVLVFQA